MQRDEDLMVKETIHAFRTRRIEVEWDELNRPDEARHDALWAELRDLGVTAFAQPESDGGLSLDARSQFEILRELGAGSPALAFSLVSHVTALSLLYEASKGSLPESLAREVSGARFALVSSALDSVPETSFRLYSNGAISLSGEMRVGLAYPDHLVVPALDGETLRLVVLRADAPGVRFAAAPSSHGLRLVPFGPLSLDCHAVRPEHVFAWPASGRAAQLADGLVTSLLCGMAGELADRAMRYALERRQGGKMIHEHDAVQDLTGPIELARRTLQTLALGALSEQRAGDGGASALAADLVRQSGLDAVQTYGGYGYMEDYRVERYLRDANTLETCWIHAAARRRAIARARFAEMSPPTGRPR